MNTLHFSIPIKAAPATVWEILWGDATYPEWTALFHEGSYVKTDWQEGGKAWFLVPSGEGMVSIIQEKKAPVKMVFRHIGMVKNFEEQPSTEESRAWEGALESYMLKEEGNGTLLEVVLDADERSAPYFRDIFPKALEVVKRLSESR